MPLFTWSWSRLRGAVGQILELEPIENGPAPQHGTVHCTGFSTDCTVIQSLSQSM